MSECRFGCENRGAARGGRAVRGEGQTRERETGVGVVTSQKRANTCWAGTMGAALKFQDPARDAAEACSPPTAVGGDGGCWGLGSGPAAVCGMLYMTLCQCGPWQRAMQAAQVRTTGQQDTPDDFCGLQLSRGPDVLEVPDNHNVLASLTLRRLENGQRRLQSCRLPGEVPTPILLKLLHFDKL